MNYFLGYVWPRIYLSLPLFALPFHPFPFITYMEDISPARSSAVDHPRGALPHSHFPRSDDKTPMHSSLTPILPHHNSDFLNPSSHPIIYSPSPPCQYFILHQIVGHPDYHFRQRHKFSKDRVQSAADEEASVILENQSEESTHFDHKPEKVKISSSLHARGF